LKNRVDEEFEKLDEEYNGIENFHKELNKINEEAQNAWSSDHIGIGRILCAHLYVEYYLNKYLKEKYNLSNNKINNLTFNKKILEIDEDDKINFIIPSLNKINNLRNKMAHNINFKIQEEDLEYFKTRQEFQSYLFITKSTINENNIFDLYELYARYTSQTINEALNDKQYLLDNIMKALSKDAVDIYFDNT
jgi:hypothetical protein